MPTLHVRLFGKLHVRNGDETPRGLEGCKAQELFGYLLLHRDRPHSREALAGLLWGETTTERSKKYLRQALWQLQTAFGSQPGPEGPGVLTVEHDWVQLNPCGELWLDVAVFERACALAQGSAGSEMDAACYDVLEQAAELYTGDLLEGCYQDWCLYERERLQNMYLAMLDKLMSYCETHREFEKGLLYGSLILGYDRARERTHRQLMSLQHLSGDRTAALRQYKRCAAALEEELGVKPDKRTVALYQQIRADHLEPTGTAQPEAPAEDEAAVSLADLLKRLRQIQTILDDVQQRVHKDIKAVELAVNNGR